MKTVGERSSVQRKVGLLSGRALIVATSLHAALYATQLSAAENSSSACDAVIGTYITTITDIEGVFASRGLMTWGGSGVLIVSDSRQAGQPGLFDPFSTGQGAWTCTDAGDHKVDLKGTSLTFTLSGERTRSRFGRVDYTATADTRTGMMTGTLSLRVSPEQDIEDADPVKEPGEVIEEFGFEGVRLVAE